MPRAHTLAQSSEGSAGCPAHGLSAPTSGWGFPDAVSGWAGGGAVGARQRRAGGFWGTFASPACLAQPASYPECGGCPCKATPPAVQRSGSFCLGSWVQL